MKEQLARLSAQFPNEYVTIQCEMGLHTSGDFSATFTAYSASMGNQEGASIKDAVDKLIAKANGTVNSADAEQTLSAMEQDAQATTEIVVPEVTEEGVGF